MKNLIAAALSLAALGCANYMKVEVAGRVVDEAGHPVAGAQVTTAPWADGGSPPKAMIFVLTDQDGRFSATLPRSTGGGQALFANVTNNRGGYIVLPGERSSDLEIVVRPLVRVRAELDPVDSKTDFLSPYVHTDSSPPTIVGVRNDRERSRSVEFRLPPGRYELMVLGCGHPQGRSFDVSTDGEVDLGAIELKPFKVQTMVGKPAPDLHVSDTRGLPKDFRLENLRGKWVALLFWNHRMEFNRNVIPAYADLYESRKEMKDQFEVVVVHSSDDVLTVADLEGRLRMKDLAVPFPIVIDEGDKSFEAYGLERGPLFRSAPKPFLIDPEGRVVAYGFPVFRDLASKLNPK